MTYMFYHHHQWCTNDLTYQEMSPMALYAFRLRSGEEHGHLAFHLCFEVIVMRTTLSTTSERHQPRCYYSWVLQYRLASQRNFRRVPASVINLISLVENENPQPLQSSLVPPCHCYFFQTTFTSELVAFSAYQPAISV
ncbi:hypothetical protein OH492_19905 [Vibrio chagasii]|nr:hypothetical protein [Vibrio chagasii]